MAQHLLYVLLDSNLPTGGFVASSGLESYAKHGFLASDVMADAYDEAEIDDILAHLAALSGSDTPGQKPKFAARRRNGPTSAQGGNITGPTLQFLKLELDNFHNSTGSYLRRAHALVATYLAGWQRENEEREALEAALVSALAALDAEHEATLLGQVQRRASKTQGIALLTLYGRGLAPPASFFAGSSSVDASLSEELEDAKRSLIAAFKLAVRRQQAHGHLALCFGVVCALLGIPPHMAAHVYLFTHLRSILSAAVRLNLIGPYLSTQILSWDGKRIIDETHDVAQPWDCAAPLDSDLGADMLQSTGDNGERRPARQELGVGVRKPTRQPLEGTHTTARAEGAHEADEEEDIWTWAKECEAGPCTTWPLIEILTSRHDLQHSRIFNS